MTTEDVDSVQSTHHRQRLRPWIVEQIHSGKYKGLEWTNDQKTEFKIPWKHAAKNDYDQEEDSKIFKAWSLHTGKYKVERDKPEPAVWKTRLRTALNKLPDVAELPERKVRGADGIPFRVYKLLPTKSHPWSRRDEEDSPERKKSSGTLKRKRRRKSSYATSSEDSFICTEPAKKKTNGLSINIKRIRKETSDIFTFDDDKVAKMNGFDRAGENETLTNGNPFSKHIKIEKPVNGLTNGYHDKEDTKKKTTPRTTPSEMNGHDNKSPRSKFFPDTLPVKDSKDDFLVSAKIASNGIPVAMTVVPSIHTATSSSSFVSQDLTLTSKPQPVWTTSKIPNGRILDLSPSTDVRSQPPRRTRNSVSNARRHRQVFGGSITNNSQISTSRCNGHSPLSMPMLSPNLDCKQEPGNSPTWTHVTSNGALSQSDADTTSACSPPFAFPSASSNGLFIAYPTGLLPANSMHHFVPAFVSNGHVTPMIPGVNIPTGMPMSLLPTSICNESLPKWPKKEEEQEEEKLEEELSPNSLPKIESVVSLGMIAAKMFEDNKKMSLSDNRNNSLSNPQPIPLNYVVKSEPTLHIEDCYESRIPNGEEFLIEIHYKSAKALKHQVTNRQGCHLYYQNVVEDENDGAFGPMSADQIPFPDFNEFCMSEKQTDLTMTLLRHMEKGLLLHCQDGNMYLTRYGRTVIFWNTSQNENQEPEKSRRGELVKIFDYRKFRAEITDCLGKLGPCPPAPQIYLGIGQQWSSKCPLKNNLVSVLVTPLKAMEEYISIATR